MDFLVSTFGYGPAFFSPSEVMLFYNWTKLGVFMKYGMRLNCSLVTIIIFTHPFTCYVFLLSVECYVMGDSVQ